MKIDEKYYYFPFGIWDNDEVGYHQPERYHGFVYRITNRRTGRYYVGKKKYCKGWKTYVGSSKSLKEEMKNSSFDDYTFEMLGIYEDEQTMKVAERQLINSAKNLDDDIYNIN